MKKKYYFIILLAYLCLICKSYSTGIYGGQWLNIDFSTSNLAYRQATVAGDTVNTGFGTTASSSGTTANLAFGTVYKFDLWDYDQTDPGHWATGVQMTPDGITDFTIEFKPVVKYDGQDITALLDGYRINKNADGSGGELIWDSTDADGGQELDISPQYHSSGSGRITIDKELNNGSEKLHIALTELGLIKPNPIGGSVNPNPGDNNTPTDSWDVARTADGFGTLDGFEYGAETIITFVNGDVRNTSDGYESTNNTSRINDDTASVYVSSDFTSTDAWENAYITTNGSTAPSGNYHTGGHILPTADGTWASGNNDNTVLWGYLDGNGLNYDAVTNPDYQPDYAAGKVKVNASGVPVDANDNPIVNGNGEFLDVNGNIITNYHNQSFTGGDDVTIIVDGSSIVPASKLDINGDPVSEDTSTQYTTYKDADGKTIFFYNGNSPNDDTDDYWVYVDQVVDESNIPSVVSVNGVDDNTEIALSQTLGDGDGKTDLADGSQLNTISWVNTHQWVEDPRFNDIDKNMYETNTSTGISSLDNLEVFIIPESSSSILVILGTLLFLLNRRRS